MGIIYSIQNNTTGKIYIGSTVNMADRWYIHKWNLRRGSHKNEHLQSAWNKYGEDDFRFSVVESVEWNLEAAEGKWIDHYDSCNRLKGYNKTRLIDARQSISEETRSKLSKLNKGNQHGLGFKQTEEARIKISLSKKGKPRPPHVQEMLRNAKGMEGKSHSTETKAKMKKSWLYNNLPIGLA